MASLSHVEFMDIPNVFTIPRMRYIPSKRIYVEEAPSPAFNNVQDHHILFRDRYYNVFQRIERNSLANNIGTLTYLEALAGSKGEKNILGFFTRDKDLTYFIEDTKRKFVLNIDHAVLFEYNGLL